MSKVLNTKALREKNKVLIRESLKHMDFATKQTLALSTGLSVASCGNLLKELLVSGEVIELELAAPRGGRPARRFKYNESFELILVIYLRKELNTEIMHINVSDLKGNTLYEETKLITIDFESIDTVVANYISRFRTINYISIGVPGIVLKKAYIKTCDITALNEINIKSMLTNKYHKEVIIENDVNAIALGYYSLVDDEQIESLVYIYYPEHGIGGAGIIINGKTINGAKNIAGEIKYLSDYKHSSFVDTVFTTINAVNSIIDPNYIIISGNEFDAVLINQLKNRMNDLEFPPNLLFETDIHDYYVLGLLFNAFTLLQ